MDNEQSLVCVVCGDILTVGYWYDCDLCDEGPFCEDCYNEHINECPIENGQFGVGE